MLALRVPRQRAEEARLVLTDNGLLDKHHRIEHVGKMVEIPMLRIPERAVSDELAELGAEVIDEREYVWRETFKEPLKNILKGIDVPEEVKPKLPSRWELLGQVLILKIDDGLDDWLNEIARAYSKELGAKTVLRDVGGIEGEYREPVLELMMGTETLTTHVENGIRYKLDAARLMFSSGNVDERIRMAGVCEDGEVVADMFAGIGYFTLPMAVHSDPAKIHAYEINPLAYEYLRHNIALNSVEPIVEPHLEDCGDAVENVADRVVMGYVGTTHEYLPKAIRILRGKGIIHYHETCPDRLLQDRPTQRIHEAAENAGKTAGILNVRTIKSYAPGVSHVVVDAFVK